MIIKSLIYYGEVNKKKRTKTKPSFKELKQCGLIKIQAVVRGWLTRKNKQVLQPVDSYSFSLVPECFHAVQPAKMDLSKSILLNAFLCSFGQSTRVNPWRYLHENEEMLWGMLKLKGDAIVSSMFFETIQHLAKWHATLQLLIEKVCVLLSKLKQEEGDEILLAKRTVTEMVVVSSMFFLSRIYSSHAKTVYFANPFFRLLDASVLSIYFNLRETGRRYGSSGGQIVPLFTSHGEFAKIWTRAGDSRSSGCPVVFRVWEKKVDHLDTRRVSQTRDTRENSLLYAVLSSLWVV